MQRSMAGETLWLVKILPNQSDFGRGRDSEGDYVFLTEEAMNYIEDEALSVDVFTLVSEGRDELLVPVCILQVEEFFEVV